MLDAPFDRNINITNFTGTELATECVPLSCVRNLLGIVGIGLWIRTDANQDKYSIVCVLHVHLYSSFCNGQCSKKMLSCWIIPPARLETGPFALDFLKKHNGAIVIEFADLGRAPKTFADLSIESARGDWVASFTSPFGG